MRKLIAENADLVREKDLKIPNQTLTIIKSIYDVEKLKEIQIQKEEKRYGHVESMVIRDDVYEDCAHSLYIYFIQDRV